MCQMPDDGSLCATGVPFAERVEPRWGGWKSAEMVRRYAHLPSAHLLSHAQRVHWQEPA
jgi:hypothetical protein